MATTIGRDADVDERALVPYLAPDAEAIASVLVWPSVSEFWMAGYLLVYGVRR